MNDTSRYIPTRLLYLHGLGSGPTSKKGLAVDAHFSGGSFDGASQGGGSRGGRFEVCRLDLRVPDPEHLRPAAMIALVREYLTAGTVLAGSSLGGRIAAEVAAIDPRVARCVLLAPAFGLAARWRVRAPAEVARWEAAGFIPTHDHIADRPARVDVGFFHALEQLDAAGPPDVRVPALVLHGVHDPTVPIEGSRAWVLGRAARLVELEDGHELVDSLPRILAEMDVFLGRTERVAVA